MQAVADVQEMLDSRSDGSTPPEFGVD